MALLTRTKLIENSLKDNYIRACRNPEFQKLVASLELTAKQAMNYTSKLEEYLQEENNCKNCHGLYECKNKIRGYTNYPQKYNNHLMFSTEACYFKSQEFKKIKESTTALQELETSSLKTIDTSDKNRYKLIKWVTNFIKEYDYGKNIKGLYLHGNFGCGKTYILSACFNEMKKRGFRTKIVYLPDLLRIIKGDFEAMNDIMDELCNIDILLIDDIGAEKVTDWGRDEILGTILQSRMNEHKTTFFTSNFTIKELEEHLSNKGVDKVKANRIVERIKQLTIDMEMLGANMRK
ncbi:MAG: AFG1/ZapE family ATPase [Bacilli bacterium]|nr:AFG1/ZapE family ATPase [Bacilli bacterium]